MLEYYRTLRENWVNFTVTQPNSAKLPPPPPQVITDNSRGEVERRVGSILMLPSPMTKECFNERRDEEG